MIFFTADTHFNHTRIIQYCSRPYESADAMNRALVEEWNKVVQPKDTVFHLGDFGFGNSCLEFVGKLNGLKFLIRGNHDHAFTDSKLKSAGFIEVYEKGLRICHTETHSYTYINCVHAPVNLLQNCVNLCGHVHDKWKSQEGVLNVGVDVRGFRPVSLQVLLDEFDQCFPHINTFRIPSKLYQELTPEGDKSCELFSKDI